MLVFKQDRLKQISRLWQVVLLDATRTQELAEFFRHFRMFLFLIASFSTGKKEEKRLKKIVLSDSLKQVDSLRAEIVEPTFVVSRISEKTRLCS